LILKRFFIYSFVVHAIVIAVILFIIPPAKDKKAGGEFFADLVSPEELIPPNTHVLAMPKVMQVQTSSSKSAPASPIGPSKHGEETSQSGQRSSPGEIKNDRPSPSPSVSETAPGGISNENKAEPSRGGTLAKPGSLGPSADLFDKNIIGAIAKRYTEKEENKLKNDTPITLDTKEFKFWNYNQRLKERIESVWHYPAEAEEKGIHGDLIIKFTLKKTGQLGEVEIVRGSGYPFLDKAATEALKEASPYWPLPEEWGMDAYTIEGKFIYTFHRSFIR
jgi:periplasmic protein TonB